jgi:hypothetical protein
MDTIIMPKNANIFICELCDFNCSKQSNFIIHSQTSKHLKRQKMIQNDTKNDKNALKNYKCECGSSFSYHSGLWRHMKNCNKNKDNDSEPTNNVPSDKQLMMILIKDNSEMKKMMMEVIKNGTHNTINTTNSHNKTFNLQFFLNEQCKDALNINEFIDSIQLQVKDLEETGHLGYVEGISKVVIDNLNALTIHKRPIHCSDSKREVIYIKDDEQWTKDNDNKDKMKNVIKKIAHKNMKQIPEWVKTHPECFDSNSKQNDRYLKIVSNSMSGSTELEQKNNMDKIISKVTKEITIDK